MIRFSEGAARMERTGARKQEEHQITAAALQSRLLMSNFSQTLCQVVILREQVRELCSATRCTQESFSSTWHRWSLELFSPGCGDDDEQACRLRCGPNSKPTYHFSF